MSSVKGKVTLVTGSAAGIGKSIAAAFAREGARLVVCDINEEVLRQTEAELRDMGAEVLAVPYDAARIEEIDKVFDALIQHCGTIDILINNTGIAGPTKRMVDMSVDEWDLTLDVNLRGAFYCMKLAAPVMMEKGYGKIVNISSMSGKKSLVNRTPYCASKMGILGLTRTAAEELGGYGINVNAVCPGAVAGPRLERVFQGLAESQGTTIQAARDRFLQPSFIKRAVPPEDIADMVLYLADDRSGSITGQDFNVNCGAITY